MLSGHPLPVSRAWQIDQRTREIIGRMLQGTATGSEKSELQHLIAERANNMLPASARARRPQFAASERGYGAQPDIRAVPESPEPREWR